MISRAYEIDEIRWRLRVSNLEARIELREIEAAAFSRQIASRFTSPARQTELAQRRLDLLSEAANLRAELNQMRQSIPRRLDVKAAPMPKRLQDCG
jgi:hypothetical protein